MFSYRHDLLQVTKLLWAMVGSAPLTDSAFHFILLRRTRP